jgi:ribosome maturation factor RimP
MASRQPKAELLDLLRGPLDDRGLELEDVEVSSAGRRRLVRVLLDKDGGVTLDDVAHATTLVSRLLDGSDELDDSPYTLEVTSPGVDRPLTAPRHWRRNVGRLVRFRLRNGEECTGRIIAAADSHASVEVDGTQREIGYADVAKARIEVEFNRPSGDGSGPPAGPAEARR